MEPSSSDFSDRAATDRSRSAADTGLGPQELSRYARQLRLPSVGVAGQARLKSRSALIVGAGGLGSPAAMYLAAAGLGRIGIADGDRVDLSNLHRQLLHRSEDVGAVKSDSARATLGAINPHVQVDAIGERVTQANAHALVSAYDFVIDGTDNFPTRYLLNDACVTTGRPLVYGSIDRFEGQVSVFSPGRGPCYRCLFPDPPAQGTVRTCEDAGVLGVLPGLIGMLQATETLKMILGLGDPLIGKLLLVDTLSMSFRTVRIERDPACPTCGAGSDRRVAPTAGAAIPSVGVANLDPADLATLLAERSPITLIDVREPDEWAIGRIPSARLIPLDDLMISPPDLPHDAHIVVYCHHGVRSGVAADLLVASGFQHVWNLTGGIDRWSVEVDPGVPRY